MVERGLLWITRHLYHSSLRKFQGFRSSVPKARGEDQIYISYYRSQYHTDTTLHNHWIKKSTLVYPYWPVYRFYSNFTNCPNNVSVSFLVQDPIQEYTLPLVVMSFQTPSVWNSLSASPCLSFPWQFWVHRPSFCRMTFNLGPFNVCSWPDSGHAFSTGTSQRWCCVPLCLTPGDVSQPTIGHVNLDQSARFLYLKFTFVID